MSSEGCDRTVFLLYTESPSFYTKRPGTSAFTSDMEPTTEALAHMEPAGPLSTQEGTQTRGRVSPEDPRRQARLSQAVLEQKVDAAWSTRLTVPRTHPGSQSSRIRQVF